VLYAVRDLGIPPGTLGFVVALGGISALVGAQFSTVAARRIPLRTLLFRTLLAYSLVMAFIPLAHGSLWMAVLLLCIAQLLGDGLSVVFFTNVAALRQKETPDALRGREGGTLHMLTGGLGLVAALVAGVAADRFGIRPVLAVAMLGAVASSLWLLALPKDKDL
jgi:predicted MFS family arabinose efflux permease